MLKDRCRVVHLLFLVFWLWLYMLPDMGISDMICLHSMVLIDGPYKETMVQMLEDEQVKG